MIVNTAHSDFNNSLLNLPWAVGHEFLHDAAQISDQKIDDNYAYRWAGKGADKGFYFNLLREREPGKTLINPDHLLEFVLGPTQ